MLCGTFSPIGLPLCHVPLLSSPASLYSLPPDPLPRPRHPPFPSFATSWLFQRFPHPLLLLSATLLSPFPAVSPSLFGFCPVRGMPVGRVLDLLASSPRPVGSPVPPSSSRSRCLVPAFFTCGFVWCTLSACLSQPVVPTCFFCGVLPRLHHLAGVGFVPLTPKLCLCFFFLARWHFLSYHLFAPSPGSGGPFLYPLIFPVAALA